MRFYWKFFFTTILTSAFFLSLGGYALIETGFDKNFERERSAASRMNELLYYTLENELSQQLKYGSKDNFADLEELLYYFADSISLGNRESGLDFRLLDTRLERVFSNIEIELSDERLSSLSANSALCFLENIGEKNYIRIVRPVSFWGEEYYLENIWDISSLFLSKQEQYFLFIKIVAALLVLGGISTALVSSLLTRPLKKLTYATEKIAAGNFQMRLLANGTDETAILSQQFNLMSEALEAKIADLEREAENKELFVAAFSHELKTPLTAIIGFSQRLCRKLKDDAELSLCAEHIFNESKRLEVLAMRLLELMVLEKQTPELVPYSAQEFFGRIAGLVSPFLEKRGIELELSVDEGSINIEPELMETVCINLIDNARKALEEGGIIRLSGHPIGDAYEFSVEDNGVGMAQEELLKVTKAFYMVDKSRSRKEGGAGLGLAICDKILKLHGTSAEIKSAPNVGTCVTVKLEGGVNHEG